MNEKDRVKKELMESRTEYKGFEIEGQIGWGNNKQRFKVGDTYFDNIDDAIAKIDRLEYNNRKMTPVLAFAIINGKYEEVMLTSKAAHGGYNARRTRHNDELYQISKYDMKYVFEYTQDNILKMEEIRKLGEQAHEVQMALRKAKEELVVFTIED